MESHTVLHPLALREALSHEKRREKSEENKKWKTGHFEAIYTLGGIFYPFLKKPQGFDLVESNYSPLEDFSLKQNVWDVSFVLQIIQAWCELSGTPTRGVHFVKLEGTMSDVIKFKKHMH